MNLLDYIVLFLFIFLTICKQIFILKNFWR